MYIELFALQLLVITLAGFYIKITSTCMLAAWDNKRHCCCLYQPKEDAVSTRKTTLMKGGHQSNVNYRVPTLAFDKNITLMLIGSDKRYSLFLKL